MFGLGRKKGLETFQTVDLPGEAGTISIPSYFTIELEDEATLLAYSKDDDAINLRVSSLEIIPKSDSQTAAYTSVLKKAQEDKREFILSGGKCIVEQEEDTEEEGLSLISKQWEIGILMAGIFKHFVQNSLHIFPKHVSPGFNNHTPAHRRVFG